jgi:hypothetical protein
LLQELQTSPEWNERSAVTLAFTPVPGFTGGR